MKNKNILYLIYPLLVVAMTFWSYSFIWAKKALVSYNPITIIYFRTIISSLFLFVVLLILKKNIRIRKKDIPIFILLAFFEPFLYFLGETTSLTMVDASTAGIMIGTIPLFTPIAAYYFLHEKISKFNLFGIVLSVLGVAVMAFDKNFEFQISIVGFLLLSLAILSTIGFNVTMKKIPEEYSVFTVIFYQNLIGSLLFLPLLLIFDLDSIISVGFNLDSFLPIIELGVFASSLAFVCYTYAVKYIPISRANTFTNIIPVFTLFFSAIILDEIITGRKIIGIIVVLFGVFVSQIRTKK